jgi:hypothetical protein
MEDTLWTEIADAPGEIFDIIPEQFDRNKFFRTDEDLEKCFNRLLNSDIDF